MRALGGYGNDQPFLITYSVAHCSSTLGLTWDHLIHNVWTEEALGSRYAWRFSLLTEIGLNNFTYIYLHLPWQTHQISSSVRFFNSFLIFISVLAFILIYFSANVSQFCVANCHFVRKRELGFSVATQLSMLCSMYLCNGYWELYFWQKKGDN